MQIPIHPICLGIFAQSGVCNYEEVKEYFNSILKAKYSFSEPLFVYGHPNEPFMRKQEMFKDIFTTAHMLDNVWYTTLGNFALWWKKRLDIRVLNIDYVNAENKIVYSLESEHDIHDVSFAVSTDALSEELVQIDPGKGEILLTETKKSKRNGLLLKIEPINAERKSKQTIILKFKNLIKEFLDWEKDTPLGDIHPIGVRDNLKFMLRKLVG